jgi:phage protein D
MTDAVLLSAAPVFKIDGQVVSSLARDVVRLEVEETTAGLKTFELRLLAFGPREGETEEGQLYLDAQTVDFGKSVEVSLGPTDDDATVFRGVISGIEASFSEGNEPEVVVYAEDRLMDLRMTRRMRTYETMSDAQVAQAIATEHGLSANATAPGPTYDVVQQWNMSDLAFLRSRAALIQAEVWIADGSLHFEARSSRQGPQLTLTQGNELVSVQLRADLAHQRSKVKVSGYDATQRERIDEEAGASAISAETSGGSTGVSVLQRAMGDRISYRVREAPLTTAEARDWAKAEMLRRARAFVTVGGVTRGSATMVVGSRLELARVGQPFDGDGYYVTRVRHTFDLVSGFRTHFEAERATINAGGR